MSPSRRLGRSAVELEGSHVGEPELSTGQALGMGHPGRPDFLRLDLAWRNRLRLEPRDLDVLRDLPQGAGIILASNHADETDFKACLELSRRCGRRFLFMMNREAFDEGYGVAGWWLQRLGAFSVERGGQNEEAKRYAIEVVKRGREVLVIFPEGEIYYLNDLVQPFKSGAVDIGMQAVVEARRTRPDWTAYLVPMALKYRYREPIAPILERRTRLMEQRLCQRMRRLLAPATIGPHHGGPAASPGAGPSSEARSGPSHRVGRAGAGGPPGDPLADRGQYAGATVNPQAQTMDRAWRLSSYLRDLLSTGREHQPPRVASGSATTWRR